MASRSLGKFSCKDRAHKQQLLSFLQRCIVRKLHHSTRVRMSERRKPSTRYKGEPPPKRRASPSPPPPVHKAPKQIHKPAQPETVEPEVGLPVKLKENQPLPTLPIPQDLDLPKGSYQDINERLARL